MPECNTRTKNDIQSEIFSNKEKIQQLVEKLLVLKEIAGDKQ